MTAKHTPGPWFVEVDAASGIGRSHSVYICDHRGWPEGQLARVNVQDGLYEREANARLIAAAPDLLAACDAALSALAAEYVSNLGSLCLIDDDGNPDVDTLDPDDAKMIAPMKDACDQLRAAIAKATGGAS